jgi:hypothetical protein
MKALRDLFKKPGKKPLGTCHLCDAPIYQGDYYGFERESSSLSMVGYFDWYFCADCVQQHCTRQPLSEESLGDQHIIWRQSGERSRITILR